MLNVNRLTGRSGLRGPDSNEALTCRYFHVATDCTLHHSVHLFVVLFIVTGGSVCLRQILSLRDVESKALIAFEWKEIFYVHITCHFIPNISILLFWLLWIFWNGFLICLKCFTWLENKRIILALKYIWFPSRYWIVFLLMPSGLFNLY